MPRVSVIVTSHQSERFVFAAVQSVLAQTERDLECLVVDDASTDGTRALLERVEDPRLRCWFSETNDGPFAAANRALAHATGEFIARLDADDVCLPQRLERQLRFFEANPSVGLAGSECHRIDWAGGSLGVQAVPESDLAIRLRCLVSSPFVHSTVMWRRALELTYDGSMRVGGDYELWLRALERTRAANLQEPLVLYRVWGGSISATQRERQQTIHDELAARAWAGQWPSLGLDVAAVKSLRAWAAAGAVGALPAPAQRLVAAVREAVLGPVPSEGALEVFARSLFSAPGAYGQPGPTTGPA